jgi:uncharacterized membrane protein SpoIIM required for sporulation
MKTAIGKVLNMQSTGSLLLAELYQGTMPGPVRLFVVALLYTGVGIYAAHRFFPQATGAVSVFLAVFGMLPTANMLVERSKMRWSSKDRRARANLRLALAVLAIFCAVLAAFGLTGLVVPRDLLRESFSLQLSPWLHLREPAYHPSAFLPILGNNLLVMLATLLLSFLYRTAGGLLVLAWNASIWGLVFVHFADFRVGSYLKIMACVLPHLTFEALGYIAAVMAGISLVRRVLRGSASAPEQAPATWREVGLLVAAAMACLVCAAALEISLAPALLGAL